MTNKIVNLIEDSFVYVTVKVFNGNILENT